MAMQSTLFSEDAIGTSHASSAAHDALDAPAESEVAQGTSAQADHLVKGLTIGPVSASAHALLGEVEKLLARIDFEDDDDFVAAIQRVAAARPHLAAEAQHLAGEILDNDALSTKSVVNHSGENIYRLLRFLTLGHQIPRNDSQIQHYVCNTKRWALAERGPSACWSVLPEVLSPNAQAWLRGSAPSGADLVPGHGEMAVGVERLNGVQDDNQRVKKKARKSCKLVKQLVRLGMETPEPPFVTFNQVLELEARAGVFGGPELKRQAGRVWLEECFALDLYNIDGQELTAAEGVYQE